MSDPLEPRSSDVGQGKGGDLAQPGDGQLQRAGREAGLPDSFTSEDSTETRKEHGRFCWQ